MELSSLVDDPQCSKRPNPLKLTLVGISRFSGALVGPSRGSRHMTSLHVKTKHTCHVKLESMCSKYLYYKLGLTLWVLLYNFK